MDKIQDDRLVFQLTVLKKQKLKIESRIKDLEKIIKERKLNESN